MRVLIIAALAWNWSSAAALADVDPMNWCPDGPTIPVAVDSNMLSAAQTIVRTTDVTADRVWPGARIAVVETALAPARTVVAGDDRLGFRAGASLVPMWVRERQSDIFAPGALAYCSISNETDGRGQTSGVCARGLDASGASSWVFRASFRNAGGGDASGRQQTGSAAGRVTTAPALQAAPDASTRRELIAGAFHIYRSPSVEAWHRRAFNSISVEFRLEGTPLFSRGLNNPLRIEDGWLVVTDFDADGTIAVSRMSDGEWTAFQQRRCPAAP